MTKVDVSGIGQVIVNPQEATSEKLLNDYLKWMQQIHDIFDKPGSFTASDYQKLQEAMQALKKLAQEGDTTSPYGPYYMPKDMLQKLDVVFSILHEMGIDPAQSMNTSDALKAMETVRSYAFTVPSEESPNKTQTINFEAIVLNALGQLTGAAKSLQDMLYTDFVLGANDVYENKLSSLEQQLELTKKVADILARLQDLRNDMISAPSTDIDFDPNDPYSKPITPNIKEMTPEVLEELYKLKEELKAALSELGAMGVTPDQEGTLASALQKVLNDLEAFIPGTLQNMPSSQAEYDAWTQGLEDLPPDITQVGLNPNPNEQKLYDWAVAHGMKPAVPSTAWRLKLGEALSMAITARNDWATAQGLNPKMMSQDQIISKIHESQKDWSAYTWALANAKGWFEDAQSTAGGGKIQDNLTQATTSTEAMSDEQKDDLRNVQYMYEQFIKIATSLMQIIQKIIEKPAQGIGR